MLDPLSQTAKAFRDTTISRSSRGWFRRTTRQWGIPHVAACPEANWREAARSNALGPRGVGGSVFLFVRHVLAQFDTTVSVTVAAANPQRLTAASGTPFVQGHTGYLVERQDTGEIHSIQGPATATGTYVELSALSVFPYFTGANFTATESFDVKILPFTIREEPGKVIIRVSGESIAASPPTYLQPGAGSPATPDTVNQPAGSEAESYNSGSMDPAPNASPLIGADARPANQPLGGHLQVEEINEIGDPPTGGPMPPYLSSGGIFDEYSEILDALLVAGVRCFFEKETP